VFGGALLNILQLSSGADIIMTLPHFVIQLFVICNGLNEWSWGIPILQEAARKWVFCHHHN
jgi:hypothetical protein